MPGVFSTTAVKQYGAEIWTTEGATAPYVPYGGSYYTTLFYTSGGYQALVGTMYINLSISQQHQMTCHFTLSSYGGGVSNVGQGAHGSYISLTHPNDGPGSAEAIRWTNTNGQSWGNGTLNITVICWGAGSNHFQSGYPGLADNFTSTQTGNFFVRAA